jgi:biopolymer transport protein ExbB
MSMINRSPQHRPLASRRFGALALFGIVSLLSLMPRPAHAWWNNDWAFRKAITVDAAAAGVQGEISDVPVLVRLHEGVFRMADALPEGADLRFVAGDDKTPLKYHIERYDDVFNIAYVWVHVPHVTAGKPGAIWMYYGNPRAVGEADARGTYDADQLAVYHFSERGQPAADASGNGNAMTAVFASVDSGLVGGAARIQQSALALPVTLSQTLAQRGTATWSMWVKPAVNQADGVIYSQREGEAGLRIASEQGIPYVSITGNAGEALRINATAALPTDRWTHLAVVSGSRKVTLYVNGEAQASSDAEIVPMKTAAVLGGDNPEALAATFNGEIDELQIARSERSAAWIKLAAENQGTEDRLVAFGGDEAQSSWSTGYVGIIMGSVTLDGWVVIGILMAMMLLSWVIMYRKSMQVRSVFKANRIFLDAYENAGGDFAVLHQATQADSNGSVALKLSGAALESMQDSPLTHMFNTGIGELHKRLNSESRRGRVGVLSEQSIEAIRAKLDSVLVREIQALNKLMVLLTIAISGGPFIGLLGTVVGVMITFAGVAAAGEVNVNAIAPGISAALAATVAGMAVAIPALFGYNYLTVRIKECVAGMNVFIDAFVTSMAENYDDSAALHAIAG